MNLTLLEGFLLFVVVCLLFDKLLNMKAKRRLRELERKLRDREIADRVYATPIPDLIKRANSRWTEEEGS